MDTFVEDRNADAEGSGGEAEQDEDYDYDYEYEDDDEEEFCEVEVGNGAAGASGRLAEINTSSSSSFRKEAAGAGASLASPSSAGSAGSNSFNILLRELPTNNTHYSELLSIFNCLRELVVTSTLVIFLEWDYAHLSKFRMATLTVYGHRSGVGVYRFRMVFPAGPKQFFPEAPPSLLPLSALPAASYIAICNHPLLCPKSWNPCQHIPVLFHNLISVLDANNVPVGLEPCMGGSFDWPALQRHDWAIEALINELCSLYIFSVRKYHAELDRILTLLADTRGGIILPCAPQQLPLPSNRPDTDPLGRPHPIVTGIGYDRAMNEVSHSFAPCKSVQLVHAICAHLSRFLSRPASSSSSSSLTAQLHWILCSPLPEMLLILLNECSREEIDRERVYVEELYTLAWRIDSFRSQCVNDLTRDYTLERHERVGDILRELYRRLIGFLADELVDAQSFWIRSIQFESEVYADIDPRGVSEEMPELSSSAATSSATSSLSSSSASSSSSSSSSTLLAVRNTATSSPMAHSTTVLSAMTLSRTPDAAASPPAGSSLLTATTTTTAPTALSGKHSMLASEDDGGVSGGASSSSSSTGHVLQQRVHHLSNLEASHSFTSTGLTTPSPRWLRELRYIGDNLSEEITLFVCDEHPSYCTASMVIQNVDSPYFGGMFFFDLHVPPNYPQVNPAVRFLTTAGGTVRFNPNLYADGKVCLSLLGTWSGEPWNPRTSNMTQVLQSILFLIFTDDPYYNEPGFERSRGTPMGLQASARYNAEVFYHTVLWAAKEHLLRLERTADVMRQVVAAYYLGHWERSIKPVWEQRLAQNEWNILARQGEIRAAMAQITASVQALQANDVGRKKQKV